MGLITFPTTGIRQIGWTPPREISFSARSPWSRKRSQIGTAQIDLWRATVEIAPRSLTEVREWLAFFALAQEPGAYFDVRLLDAVQHGGDGLGTVTSSTATTVSFNNVVVSQAPLVPKGGFVSVVLPSGHQQTVIVTEDVNTNGSGAGTATFRPPFRQTPSVGAVINTATPAVRMALADQDLSWLDGFEAHQLGALALEEYI